MFCFFRKKFGFEIFFLAFYFDCLNFLWTIKFHFQFCYLRNSYGGNEIKLKIRIGNFFFGQIRNLIADLSIFLKKYNFFHFLYRHRCFYSRMRIVIFQRKIFKIEIENIFDFGVEFHCRE